MYQNFFLEIISIFLVYAAAGYITETTDTSNIIEDSNLIGTCYGTEWVAYKDEKCFKLIRKWTTCKEAEDICKEERLESDSYTPTLVSIKSATEQEYLTKFVFDTSGVKVNVWIGARRLPENVNEFVWNDGSVIEFTNWVEGGPTEEIGRDCVEMQSRFTSKFSNISDSNLRGINGKWRDVTCESANYVICQKLQAWSFPKLQQTFLDARKELKDSLEIVTKQLSDTKNQLTNTQNELHDTTIRLSYAENKIEDLKRNPIPIGFVYVQLSGQPDPNNLWPTVLWGDVTTEYAGLFFRAEGGDSAAFGETQGENSPRIISVAAFDGGQNGHVYTWANIIPGQWSDFIFSGSNVRPLLYWKFLSSSGEVRPRNQAIRIWKRVN